MPYWILFASIIANHGGVSCDMSEGSIGLDGSRCHLSLQDTKYPSLKDCQVAAPKVLKESSPFADVTITWFCKKYNPEEMKIRQEQSIILRHDKSRESE